MTTDIDRLLDRIAILQMGNAGDTMAHVYLENRARSSYCPSTAHLTCSYFGREGTRLFIPPKEEDRVVMFPDKSGVYIFDDGFVMIMDADISHEVSNWTEIE